MSWWIHHCGEHANRSFSEIYETELKIAPQSPDRYGPFESRELAEKEAKRRGFSLTSLREAYHLSQKESK